METHHILYAIPFFFLLIGIEWLAGRIKKKKYYRFNDAITNLNIGVGQQLVNAFAKVILYGVYLFIYENWAFFHLPANVWSFLGALLLFDFFFYWAHRWSHEINFFWGAHVVHHSSEEYNLSVALRQPWFHNLIAFFIFLPIPFLGFDPLLFLGTAAAHTLYQFWIHTKAIKKMPKWFEFIFNTPSHHRVHHGVDPKYIDKNHAGVFMFWDRLFGTFQEEEEEPNYGITTPIRSWNPTWANLHYYVDMFRNARRMTNWKDKFRVIFARPGWMPEEFGGYQAPKKVDRGTRKLFDTKTSKWLNVYVLAQFVSVLVGSTAFLYHFDTISTFYQWVFFGILILTIMICGAIFENKKWIIGAEYVRLLLVIASLNSFYYYWHVDWFSVMLVFSLIFFVLFVSGFTLSWITGFRQSKVLAG